MWGTLAIILSTSFSGAVRVVPDEPDSEVSEMKQRGNPQQT